MNYQLKFRASAKKIDRFQLGILQRSERFISYNNKKTSYRLGDAPPVNNGTILLVEDNPDDVALTLRAFKKSHIINPVVVATNGEDALDYLFGRGSYHNRNPMETPSIILLDVNLPRVDGVEVLRQIRSDHRTKFTRVIMLTSSREEHDVLRSYENGANSYIRKPVDFEEFMTAVGRLGLYWLLLNENPPLVREVAQ